MLFNSFEFIMYFLPAALAGYYLAGLTRNLNVVLLWLVGVSLFFYGWWNPAYLALILFSIGVNYAVSIFFLRQDDRCCRFRKLALSVGIIINIALLAYFKYANFFVDTLATLTDSDFNMEGIALPLAISFFTFQQIAYLVDSYRGKTQEQGFLSYCLFVTFFPQLVSGPIVHHRHIVPQFPRFIERLPHFDNLSLGLTIFSLGLFKKVMIADNLAPYADMAFDTVGAGGVIATLTAWQGLVAYAGQIYFDFSGYCDMAMGLACMFGITLPINFNSPYKAVSISDFWRRWNITLSHFLRDYLYIPLGGNRQGLLPQHVNLMLTMLIGGLWHGASWAFVIWGGMHGVYLIINHLFKRTFNLQARSQCWGWLAQRTLLASSRVVTVFVVLMAWVWFRAVDLESGVDYYAALFGFSDASAVISLPIASLGVQAWMTAAIPHVNADWLFIIIAIVITQYCPNTQEITGAGGVPRGAWRPTFSWAMLTSLCLIVPLYSIMTRGYEEFIYRVF